MYFLEQEILDNTDIFPKTKQFIFVIDPIFIMYVICSSDINLEKLIYRLLKLFILLILLYLLFLDSSSIYNTGITSIFQNLLVSAILVYPVFFRICNTGILPSYGTTGSMSRYWKISYEVAECTCILFFCLVCSVQCMCLFQAFIIRQQYW
jgi:hypothetical protein